MISNWWKNKSLGFVLYFYIWIFYSIDTGILYVNYLPIMVGTYISELLLIHLNSFHPTLQSLPKPTVIDVSSNRWFVGWLLREIFCIMNLVLHSCCWKGYRNDNWYKRSRKPVNENSQTTVWRLSKFSKKQKKTFWWNLDIFFRKKNAVIAENLDCVKVVDILEMFYISIF